MSLRIIGLGFFLTITFSLMLTGSAVSLRNSAMDLPTENNNENNDIQINGIIPNNNKNEVVDTETWEGANRDNQNNQNNQNININQIPNYEEQNENNNQYNNNLNNENWENWQEYPENQNNQGQQQLPASIVNGGNINIAL